MNIFNYFHDFVEGCLDGLAAAGRLPEGLDFARVAVEPPRDPSHGDLSTNAAMVLAKQAGMKPRDLAEALAPELERHDAVKAVEIAGPGFINLRLDPNAWRERLEEVIEAGTDFGASDMGAGEPVNVEFVSANPTGLLHIGHARGAVVGDALASLLQKVGYNVCREYYMNDRGGQIDILIDSFLKRTQQLTGQDISEDDFDGLYPGDEVREAAQASLDRLGRDWMSSCADEAELRSIARDAAIEHMMSAIKADLADTGVFFDVFTSEKDLADNGAIDAALSDLEAKQLIYVGVLEPPKGKLPDDWEERPQTLFRATEFGDDVDRPLKKSNGDWTYFAADIAYHLDKYRRGFRTMIDVWGADHGGYVKRMKAAVSAITEGQGELDVKLCQLVNLLDRGEPVKMSKRAGTVVTLRDVLDRLGTDGKDILRFIMLTRKNDASLDFDFARVTEQSKDNPVFYVQYAHARARSVFRQAADAFPDADFGDKALTNADYTLLIDDGEMALIKKIAGWPRAVESAAETHEPHRLAFYLNDIAADFHAQWNKGREDPSLRYILEGDHALTLARLAMVRAMSFVIASGLEIFGVTPAEEMR